MKKNFTKVVLSALFVALTAVDPVFAATDILFSPAAIQVQQGKTAAINILVNPAGAANYTIKTELRFPADMVSVQSFSFGQGWMPLYQSGYDLTDNGNGILIKTAGYSGGLSDQKIFGTVVFSAKKTGQAVINISSNSMALDVEGKNVLKSSLSPLIVTVSPVAIQPLPTTKPKTSPSPSPTQTVQTASPSPLPEPLPTGSGITPSPQPISQEETASPVGGQPPANSFVAAVANALNFGTGNSWISLLALAAIAAAVILAGYKLLTRKPKQGTTTE